MQIGQVVQLSGIPAPTIRFYEAQKLLSRPTRTPAGYRVYSERVIDELAFIRRAQSMGLTLEETREILSIGRQGKKPCGRVTSLCDAHLAEIDRRMAELRAFRRHLKAARQLASQDCGFTPEGFCRAIFDSKNDSAEK